MHWQWLPQHTNRNPHAESRTHRSAWRTVTGSDRNGTNRKHSSSGCTNDIGLPARRHGVGARAGIPFRRAIVCRRSLGVARRLDRGDWRGKQRCWQLQRRRLAHYHDRTSMLCHVMWCKWRASRRRHTATCRAARCRAVPCRIRCEWTLRDSRDVPATARRAAANQARITARRTPLCLSSSDDDDDDWTRMGEQCRRHSTARTVKFHGTIFRVASSWHPRKDPRSILVRQVRHARFPRDLLNSDILAGMSRRLQVKLLQWNSSFTDIANSPITIIQRVLESQRDV